MKKTALVSAAALILGIALTATAEETKKPSSSMTTGAAQQGGLALKTPFNVWPDGQYIFVVNHGNADWKGGLDVSAVCASTAANAPANACGPNFPGGKFKTHLASFPNGYGNSIAPVKGSGNAQQTSGSGWVAVFMGLPAGSYKITATAANNTSPETAVTISAASPPRGIQVGPATLSVKPK